MAGGRHLNPESPTLMANGWAMADSARVNPAAPVGAVTIGPARFRDLRAVARVQAHSFRPRLAYGLGTLVLLWALPHVRFLVAKASVTSPASTLPPPPPTVVGCIIGDRTRGEVRVINLAVDPTVRRRGVGRGLLAALEDVFPEGDLVLMVEENNAAARALYLQAGYRQVGVAQNYYGRGRSGLWMQKRREGGQAGRREDGLRRVIRV